MIQGKVALGAQGADKHEKSVSGVHIRLLIVALKQVRSDAPATGEMNTVTNSFFAKGKS